MRYLHYVIDKYDRQIETQFSSFKTFKISMISLAKIEKGIYKIWDKETNEIITF